MQCFASPRMSTDWKKTMSTSPGTELHLHLVVSEYRLRGFQLLFSLLKIINKMLLCKKLFLRTILLDQMAW